MSNKQRAAKQQVMKQQQAASDETTRMGNKLNPKCKTKRTRPKKKQKNLLQNHKQCKLNTQIGATQNGCSLLS